MVRPNLKIMVATPAHDNVPVFWAHDYANLASHSVAVFLANEMPVSFGLTILRGTYLHAMRQELLEEALRAGATHLLWVDADMRFPKDALLRLLVRNKAVVGINYSQRGVSENGNGPDYVAIKDIEGGRKLVTGILSEGVEEVEALGFGLVLMDLRKVGPKLGERPWFDFARRPDGQLIGEDVYFCRKLAAAGVPLYVDHDLSKECAHIGQFEYRTDHISALREAAHGAHN